jgi:hypothetical protein
MCKELVLPTRLQVLSLYKRLIKESKKMIMPARKAWLLHRVRLETREVLTATDEKIIIDHYRLGEVHLDSIRVQVNQYNKYIHSQEPEVTLDRKIEKRKEAFDPFDSESEDEASSTPHPLQRPEIIYEHYSNTKDVDPASVKE